MSRKSERLVNLTIALLATKRWLTKSQIFSAIDGYEGEADSMERMFERDKDDLRNLGIEIEVGSFDPLFEDEVGYRIRPESYQIQISDISPRELSLISLATQAWKGAVLDSSAHSALAKLKSMGVESDFDSIPALVPRVHNSDRNFLAIIEALIQRRAISFSYLNTERESQSRVIEPYGVGTKSGFWYVAGFDLDRKDLRLFRLDRFDSDVKLQGKQSVYEIPDSFDMRTILASPENKHVATIKARWGKAVSLRSKATEIRDVDDWSILTVPYSLERDIVSEVLWHGPDVVILEPEQIRDIVVSALQEIVDAHV